VAVEPGRPVARRTADVAGSADPPEPASSGTPAQHPTAAPWPSYEVDDYTYTLRVMCFCVDGGIPEASATRPATRLASGCA
jgi:hypothetical protein